MAYAQTHAGSHGSLTRYLAGFFLSVLLTAGAFGVGLYDAIDATTAMIAIAVLGFLQVVVHLVCFLHLTLSPGQGWNVLSLCYTILAAAFLILGTVWVMRNVEMLMMSR
ncbi:MULTISPECIES: cytochrome o ubiquinol oxidase subunit IV [Paraburkholderia]|uniref:Cytochrome bo(3) ubiquinol oxidase subunit 4 n=1 Tax=Paraburkholderia youngii TaxID=2782701 RepID=A0ABX2NY90_9BURK|nr:cytochrome o ubiquinol oxidase subunit IV [Paraburkholderia youngii]NVI09503.1 cytochrome o ubiquinol oxidase subunit IV [Paraburkholderia youngii]